MQINRHKWWILDFPQERLQFFVEHSRMSSYLVLIGFIIFSFQPFIFQDGYWHATLLMYWALIIRILSLEAFIYLTKKQPRSEKWFLNYENIFAIVLGIAGFCYAYATLIFAQKIFLPLMLTALGLFFFGLLRNSQTSVKASSCVIVGFVPTLAWFYFPEIVAKERLIVIIFAAFFFISGFIYLVKSQYLFARAFVKRLALERQQKEYINQLHDKLALEEALKKQIEINTQNARLTSLGEMAAGIAHEINNPLTIISLHVKSLDKQKTAQGIPLDLWENGKSAIEKTVKRASQIISSLRSFARVDSLDELEIFLLKDELENALLLVKKKFEYAGIRLRTVWNCSDHIRVQGSRVALGQVIVNLVQNSFYEMSKIDASQSRWCNIEISLQETTVYIKIIDAGIGIPQEILTNLFTPFVTSKPPGEGTGIGLSLSKTMMNKMQGDLVYDAQATQTTFVITLPLAPK